MEVEKQCDSPYHNNPDFYHECLCYENCQCEWCGIDQDFCFDSEERGLCDTR